VTWVVVIARDGCGAFRYASATTVTGRAVWRSSAQGLRQWAVAALARGDVLEARHSSMDALLGTIR